MTHAFNPLQPEIGIHILHTDLYTSPMVLKWRICLTSSSFSVWGSFFLFSWPYTWFNSDTVRRNDNHDLCDTVQRSTNWANKPTGSWLLSWFQIKPWSDELMAVNIWISYMWTAEKEMNMDEFKSRKGLNFFWRYFHYCLNSVHYCEDRFQIHTIYLRRRQNRKIIKKLQTSLGKPYTLNVWSRGKQWVFSPHDLASGNIRTLGKTKQSSFPRDHTLSALLDI